MTDPGDAADERAAPEGRRAFPVMFEAGRRSWTRRVLSPFLGLFRSGPATAEPAPRGGGSVGGGVEVRPDGWSSLEDDIGAKATAPEAGPDPLAGPVQRATLQLLPGRLVPLDPSVVQQEVRFLRSGGRESVVTLGWDVGEPPGHVTLDHPSIQPRHARMCFRDGQWSIENLSPRDPVEVNGEPLRDGGEPHLLRTGDRVRLGQAVFRFVLT